MERGKTKLHVRSVCDYTEVACAYESLGCGVRMLREDAEKHKREARERHMDLALDTVSLREEQHKTLSEGEAMVFKLPGYASKKEKNARFYSPLFYTSSGGYKMCIRVDANGYGDGKGTHVSVFTKLLQGRYDNQLHWPFLGSITYVLLNQLADDKHHSRVAIYDTDNDMQVGSSRGFHKFLPHSSLPHDPATTLTTHCTSECQSQWPTTSHGWSALTKYSGTSEKGTLWDQYKFKWFVPFIEVVLF